MSERKQTKLFSGPIHTSPEGSAVSSDAHEEVDEYGRWVKYADLLKRLDEAEVGAYKDALTGIDNRAGYNQAIDRLRGSELESGKLRGAAVIFDLDNFKRTNDTLGHAVGDEVLKAFAEILKASTRAGDVVARNGGDEFVMFLPQSSENLTQEQITEVTVALRAKIIECLTTALDTTDTTSQEFQILGNIEFSMGLAYGDLDSINELQVKADENMYKDKENRKNKMEQPESDLDLVADTERYLEARKALHRLAKLRLSGSALLGYVPNQHSVAAPAGLKK
jgi:diguanylate cyclase (GGDEF)-like protein